MKHFNKTVGWGSGLFAVAGLWLLRYLLHIPYPPFAGGWLAVLGWALIFFALLALCHAGVGVFRAFRPIPKEPDLYTAAKAEIEAERAGTVAKNAS